MGKRQNAINRLLRRRNRSKRSVRFHPERPRLCVYRSNRHIEAQIIDDFQNATLVSASSRDKDLRDQMAQAETKTDMSKLVGAQIAAKAKKKKITKIVFDRNGYPYHGRIKALAEAAREGGLEF
ncbi:MAG: 50S ribosomal protein L18 [Candidatus Neomarinimicrobiota bacterium]|nr:MAG: 50S ribosomal protein L18 [Candidatus Neomarinimicrobiota bacterium]